MSDTRSKREPEPQPPREPRNQTNTTSSDTGGVAPPRSGIRQQAPTLIDQAVGFAFAWWRLKSQLGPGSGFITERLHDLDLSEALPSEPPSRELIDPRAVWVAYDFGPTEQLRSANAWAAALETYIRHDPTQQIPQGTVMTTYGFVRVHGGVQLGVVHFLRPMMALAAEWPQPITIMGWRFPVIILPWLLTEHSGSPGFDGNCWVKFLDEAGVRRPGILTAHHAILPEGAPLQAQVSVNVSRSLPPGRLQHSSAVMDAAVMAVDEHQWGAKVLTPHSKYVGLKPVRLITGHGTLDADVTQTTGLVGSTIPVAEPGKEPMSGVFCILNRMLEPGDSGCLVVDLELARDGKVHPYLIYRGIFTLSDGIRTSRVGVGLLIEQAHKMWDLECYL